MQSDSDNHKLDDHELVNRVLNGDSESFVELCRRYHPALVALAHAVLMDHHLAEDAAQEALVLAYQQLDRLKKPASFGAWIGTICRYVARDMLKQQLRHRRLPLAETEPKQDRQPQGQDDLLQQALMQLSPALREVIFLRYCNQKSYRQMAGILGISEEAIDGRLRRAKKKLNTLLIKLGYTP